MRILRVGWSAINIVSIKVKGSIAFVVGASEHQKSVKCATCYCFVVILVVNPLPECSSGLFSE